MATAFIAHKHSNNPAALRLYNSFGAAMVAGKKDEALGFVAAAADMDSGYFAAQMMSGLMFHQEGKYDEAATHLFHVLRLDPQAEFAQGAFLDSIKRSEAIKEKLIGARRSELVGDDRVKAVMALMIVDDAFANSKRGDIVRALSELETATIRDHQTLDGYVNANFSSEDDPDKILFLGLIHLNLLKFVSVEKFPDPVRSKMSLDVVRAGKKLMNDSFLSQDGNYELVDAFFLRAIELDPTSPLPEINLSKWYDGIGDIRAAHEHGRAALDKICVVADMNEYADNIPLQNLKRSMKTHFNGMQTKLDAMTRPAREGQDLTI